MRPQAVKLALRRLGWTAWATLASVVLLGAEICQESMALDQSSYQEDQITRSALQSVSSQEASGDPGDDPA